MKVLHVITSLSRSAGGPARSVQGLVAAECAAGVDAWVWAINGGEPWVAGVRCVGGIVDSSEAVRTPLPRSCRLDEFDLVHIHGIWSWKLHRVAVMCRKAGVPYVIAPRGMLEPWSLKQKGLKKRIARWLYQDRDLKLAAALHARAESEAAQFRKLGFKNKIIVSPNGVNVPEGKVGKRGGGGRWNALDSALREAWASDDLREMGVRGRQLVESKYTWAAVVGAMRHGYEQALNACELAPCDTCPNYGDTCAIR